MSVSWGKFLELLFQSLVDISFDGVLLMKIEHTIPCHRPLGSDELHTDGVLEGLGQNVVLNLNTT